MKLMFVYCCACKGKGIWLIYEKKNLILYCSFLELVVLCTVMCRKIHTPVKTPKWPLAFCRDMSWPVN